MDDEKVPQGKPRSRGRSPSRVTNSPITRRRKREMEKENVPLSEHARINNTNTSDDSTISERMGRTTIEDNLLKPNEGTHETSLKMQKHMYERSMLQRTVSGNPKLTFDSIKDRWKDDPDHLYGLDKDPSEDLHTKTLSRYKTGKHIKKEPEDTEMKYWYSSLLSIWQFVLEFVMEVIVSRKVLILVLVLLFMSLLLGRTEYFNKVKVDGKNIEELQQICYAKVESLLAKVKKQEETIQFLFSRQKAFDLRQNAFEFSLGDLQNNQTRDVNSLDERLQRANNDRGHLMQHVDAMEKTVSELGKKIVAVDDRATLLDTKVNEMRDSFVSNISHLGLAVSRNSDELRLLAKNISNNISHAESKNLHNMQIMFRKVKYRDSRIVFEQRKSLKVFQQAMTAETERIQEKVQVDMQQVGHGISSLESTLKSMKNRTLMLIQNEIKKYKLAEHWQSNGKSLCKGEECKYNDHNAHLDIQNALELERADVLGITDYGLKAAGGEVHSHSETYLYASTVVTLFGMPLYHDPTPPYAAISPSMEPGSCWYMKGTQGFLVLKLAVPVLPNMVTVEHLDKKIDHYTKDRYAMAPRDMEVYGWNDANGKSKVLLGSLTYDRGGSALQTFNINKRGQKPLLHVEFRILSNYGNPKCTCIYRLRVHGEPVGWLHDDDIF